MLISKEEKTPSKLSTSYKKQQKEEKKIVKKKSNLFHLESVKIETFSKGVFLLDVCIDFKKCMKRFKKMDSKGEKKS